MAACLYADGNNSGERGREKLKIQDMRITEKLDSRENSGTQYRTCLRGIPTKVFGSWENYSLTDVIQLEGCSRESEH